MNKLKNGVLLFIFFIASSFTPAHKFYFSLTTIKLDANKKKINITCKLFIDDFENTINNNLKTKYNLSQLSENKEAQNAVFGYVNRHLQLILNNSNVPLKFVGFETEADIVWIYLESTSTEKKLKTIKVKNSLLCDFNDEQINLVQFTGSNINRTEKLNCTNTEVLIPINN